MSGFWLLLKGQATILNIVVLLLLAALLLRRLASFKAAKATAIIAVLIFLLASTSYVPHWIAGNMEARYPALQGAVIQKVKAPLYIQVLGSGYSRRTGWPPNVQLGMMANGRLAEAIRLFRLADSAFLVCSGNTGRGIGETQAQVTAKAAIALGVPDSCLITLNTPGTTEEEAEALYKKLGPGHQIVVVTDALHMPRAISAFARAGFVQPLAAPVNFRAAQSFHFFSWLPNAENLLLSDKILHECLGNLKAFFN
jgi:uncharacterized SAM-binding protein YcdF (DUF218 family)